MINITVPDNNTKERAYIIQILFREFLGLEYQLQFAGTDYRITLENGSVLVVKDGFFTKFEKPLSYLERQNIPTNIAILDCDYVAESNMPILFGDAEIAVSSKKIETNADIFASSFFMLTRWEEHANPARDEHQRFPYAESLASRFGFADRPLVNEYVEFIWNLLSALGYTGQRKQHNFKVSLTHDIDNIQLFQSVKSSLRRMAGDLLVRRQPIKFVKTLVSYFGVKLGVRKDPFDTFDYFMDISEALGTKSQFFFMAKGLTQYDNRYKTNDKAAQLAVQTVKRRGHLIALHPSYNTYADSTQMQKELSELNKNFETNIARTRQHYLRFELPTTWQILNDNGIELDSTMGYAEIAGFRAGVCYQYSVFNVLSRESLKLKESPLLLMDSSFLYPGDLNTKQHVRKVLQRTQKYQGEFVVLWHNCSPYLLEPSLNQFMHDLISESTSALTTTERA